MVPPEFVVLLKFIKIEDCYMSTKTLLASVCTKVWLNSWKIQKLDITPRTSCKCRVTSSYQCDNNFNEWMF